MVALLVSPKEELCIEQSELEPSFAPFLERISWGTEGAQYRLCDYEATLQHLPHARYLTLKKNDTLIGLRMFLEKVARTPDGPLHCFYHSLFSIDPHEKGKGYGVLLAQAMLDRLMPRLGSRGVIYSHVEKDNTRSRRVHERLGYQPIGEFSVMSFSRVFPRKSSRLIPLPVELNTLVLNHLHTQYAGHAMTDFALSFSPEDYYVLIQNGELLAGVQVLRQRWIIDHLEGVEGKIALKVLPRVPFVRDLFNPSDLRFLKFGNIFFKPGRPEAAFDLMESVLARFQQKSAMLMLDKTSPVYQSLSAAGRFGILNALMETPIQIFGRFQGFSPTEIERFVRRPKVISPIDI